MFVWVHSNVFIYPLHVFISHRCTTGQFSNNKTISFHEQLHAITVNSCWSQYWLGTDRHFSSTRSFKVLQKQLGRWKSPSHLLEGTLECSELLHCRYTCEQIKSSHLLSLKQTAPWQGTPCCFFHSFIHFQEWKLAKLFWLTNQNFQQIRKKKEKKDDSEDFSSLLQRRISPY